MTKALPPWDETERWQQLAPRFAHLAAAPKVLVPTMRGPGRPHTFAQTSGAAPLALMEGVVTKAYAGVEVETPAVLVIDSKRRKLVRRVALPLGTGTTLRPSRTLMTPNGDHVWVCFDKDADVRSYVVASRTGHVTSVATDHCFDWYLADGALLQRNHSEVALDSGITFRLPDKGALPLPASASEAK